MTKEAADAASGSNVRDEVNLDYYDAYPVKHAMATYTPVEVATEALRPVITRSIHPVWV